VTPTTVIKNRNTSPVMMVVAADGKMEIHCSQVDIGIKLSSKNSERTTIAILIKLLLIKIVANNLRGLSLKIRICSVAFEFSCVIFSRSLMVRLKKATSELEINAEQNSSNKTNTKPIDNPIEEITRGIDSRNKDEKLRSGSGSKLLELFDNDNDQLQNECKTL